MARAAISSVGYVPALVDLPSIPTHVFQDAPAVLGGYTYR